MARGKGEGSIYQDARGLWRATVELPPSADGKRRRKVISSKKKTVVVSKMRALQNEVASHGDMPTRGITVQGWVDKWLDEIAPKKIAPGPLRSYRSALNLHVCQRYGKKKLSYLTPGRIRTLITEIERTKSAGTARNLHNNLASCLKDAAADGYLPKHPMEHLDAPRRAKKPEAALNTERTIDLLKWLAQKMDAQDDDWSHIAPLFIAYLLTGARRGELLGLRPEYVGESLDVEWQLQRIQAGELAKVSADFEREHVSGNFYLTRPKYESTRSYPLVEPLRSVMHSLADITPPGQLIFRRPDGEPWDKDGITYRWKKLMVASGIEVHAGPEKLQTPRSERVKLHGARHGLIDILYALDIPEHIIVEIAGHADLKTTRGYRTRQSPAVKGAMESVSHLLQMGDETQQQPRTTPRSLEPSPAS